MTHEQDELAKFFTTNGKQIVYANGELILRADDEPQGAYYIVSGFVKVYSINSQGEEYVHIIYGDGEIFPMVWILRKISRSVFYEALGSVTILRAPSEALVKRLEQDKIASSFLNQVVDQFSVYSDRVDNLEYKYARERLVYRLLFLAGRFGEQTGNSVIIAVPLTQQMIGGSINLSRESVGRELERLERKGLVEYNKQRRIVINDIAELTKELKDPIRTDYWGLIPTKSTT